MLNGLFHHYRLGEFTLIFRGIRRDFLFTVSMNFSDENRIAPDGMLHSAASHLGLYCLPMSRKKDARLI